MQRNLRKENGGEIPKSFIRTYPANIKYDKKNYKVKIRSKGVRNIHWMSKDKMSYKIDLIEIKDCGAWRNSQCKSQLQETILMSICFINYLIMLV